MKRKACQLLVAAMLLSFAPAVASAQNGLFDTYLDAATKAIKEPRYDIAETYAIAAIKEAEKFDTGDPQRTDPRLVVSLHLLAQVYYAGKKDKIKDVFGDRKMRIDVKDLGPELLLFASQLYTVGKIYYEQGEEARRRYDSNKGEDDPANKDAKERADFKFELAKRMLLISWNIRKRNLEANDPDVASSLSLLGFVHLKLRESNDMVARFEEALNGREARTASAVQLMKSGYRYSVSKPSWDISVSQEVAPIELTLARIFIARDLIHPNDQKDKKRDDAERQLRAERLLKETLEDWKEWPEHDNVALCLNNLGLLYSSQERFDDAEPMYKRSLAILEKIKAPTENSVVTVRKNYAEVLRKKAELSRKAGRETEAKEYEERAKKLSNE